MSCGRLGPERIIGDLEMESASFSQESQLTAIEEFIAEIL